MRSAAWVSARPSRCFRSGNPKAVRRAAKSRQSRASIEEFGERNGGIGVFGAEFLGLPHPIMVTLPGSTLVRIEDPDVGDSEVEIVLHPLAHLGEPVILGEDLNTDHGRRAKDLFGLGFGADADVRYAEPGRRDPHALFRFRIPDV